MGKKQTPAMACSTTVTASQEAGVGYAGDVCFEPYPKLGKLTYDISWSYGGERRKWRFTSGAEAEQYLGQHPIAASLGPRERGFP